MARKAAEGPPVEVLLTAAEVRRRAQMVFNVGLADGLDHFRIDDRRLDACADYVAETIHLNYPTLDIPPHSRWRHFRIDGDDRWAALASRLNTDRAETARIRFDLAVVSVLLDAGAGSAWRWLDPKSGRELARSEGLAIASLDAFKQGLFSSDQAKPLRADAAGLQAVTRSSLAKAFQVSQKNPLDGLDGRVGLLRRLGAAMASNTAVFAKPARIGGLFDRIVDGARGTTVRLPDVLGLLLESLGPIWSGRLEIDGVPLGDTWRHWAIDVRGPTAELMPFHKLSQWLAYSLIEPLQEAGFAVADQDGLTGLAEYRNGGLLIDLDVIVPREPQLLRSTLAPGDEAVVEWRALTVALLDEIAPLIRCRLGRAGRTLSLAALLEGGTWAAGRRVAAEKRPGGPPPITVASDGSVF